MNVLPLSFYQQEDVVKIAKALLGKYLFTHIENSPITGGRIIETEAYAGASDRASHSYGMLRTKRTEILYAKGGVAYVYFCYGMHYLLNVVTHKEEVPHAVLIRAIEPLNGIEAMCLRRNRKEKDLSLTSGPAMLTQALGITLKHNGLALNSKTLWIEDRKEKVLEKHIVAGPRIGVAYAKEDALLPYRFSLRQTLELA